MYRERGATGFDSPKQAEVMNEATEICRHQHVRIVTILRKLHGYKRQTALPKNAHYKPYQAKTSYFILP